MKGFTDYGEIHFNAKVDEPATSALFIMACEINGNMKIPLGYVLTNGSDALLIASVITKSLEAMHSTGSSVLTITFDGLPANFAAAELLGANFDVFSPDFKTF